MILIIANRYDMAARGLVARWAAYGATLLTPDALSVAGWSHYLGAIERSTLVAGGRMVGTVSVSGILTRLSCVMERDLPSIKAADRPYVAGEMTAFLISWLFEMSCPKINPPTATCLSGPGWRPEQWVQAASSVGIPALPVHRSSVPPCQGSPQAGAGGRAGYEWRHHATPGTVHSVTVVGDRCFHTPLGTTQDDVAALSSQALTLAETAGVTYLKSTFAYSIAGWRLVDADPWPHLEDERVTAALQSYLCGEDKRNGTRDKVGVT